MRYFLFILVITNVSACSLNKNSKYWTEDPLKKKVQDKKLLEILEKSNDIRLMSLNEYNIYIDNYIINNKYPNLIK